MRFLKKHLVVCVISLISLLGCANSPGKLVSEQPPGMAELTIESHGHRMSGLAYLAAGDGLHPTVLLLHGYPGNEKNLDVAQALRSAGWNVVFFHYRGAWGSEGEFSFRNAESDVQVVLEYLENEKNSANLSVDTKQISIVGHSMGGHMAIAGIYDNANVRCAVAYDPANLGANGRGIFSDPGMTNIWKDYADTDVIPMELHIKPLVQAISATQGNRFAYKLIDDDHSFSSSRTELIESTIEFLDSSCRS